MFFFEIHRKKMCGSLPLPRHPRTYPRIKTTCIHHYSLNNGHSHLSHPHILRFSYVLLPPSMEVARNHSPSLKHKLRSSLCLSCCFRSRHHETLEPNQKPKLLRSSSLWLRSRSHEFPEIKEKCLNLFCRMRKRRRHSGDFGYDPLSYALNFDEGSYDTQADDFHLRNFSARLPDSPSMPSSSVKRFSPPVAVSREITVFR